MMKKAPNFKHLPADKFTEAIIFAGSEAYAHAKGWEEGMGRQVACDSTPPVYLGTKQLQELKSLRIVDDGRRSARVYLAGVISPVMINAIAEKLALAGVQDAKLYKGIPDRQPEDWRDYLARLREQAERGENMILQLPSFRKVPVEETDDELKPRVESRDDGVFWVTPKVDKESGDTRLIAGVTLNLAGFGKFSGKYLVSKATHAISNGGYTTSADIRRVIEGY